LLPRAECSLGIPPPVIFFHGSPASLSFLVRERLD
jgi:hypothetical protein